MQTNSVGAAGASWRIIATAVVVFTAAIVVAWWAGVAVATAAAGLVAAVATLIGALRRS